MKDLKLDRQRLWEGPGWDPRGDRWEGDVDDDQNEDEDLGPWFINTVNRRLLRRQSTTSAPAVQNGAHFLDIPKARRVGDEGTKWPRPN